MTSEEIKEHDTALIKDFFNGSQDIYNFFDNTINITESISLEYADIQSVIVKQVTNEYTKWNDSGDIEYVKPTDETFNDITLVMSNGKRLTICAGDAVDDGEVSVFSEDAVCSSTKYE